MKHSSRVPHVTLSANSPHTPPQKSQLTCSEAVVWARGRAFAWAPVIPARRGLDRDRLLGGGRLRLGGGLHGSCSRSGRRGGDGGGARLPRLRVAGSVASIAGAAPLPDSAAWGDLLAAERRREAGGAGGGGGHRGAAVAGADAVVEVWGATAVSVGGAAIGRVVGRWP